MVPAVPTPRSVATDMVVVDAGDPVGETAPDPRALPDDGLGQGPAVTEVPPLAVASETARAANEGAR